MNRTPILRAAVAAAAIVALADCSDAPTGPDGPRETPIAMRQLVSGTVAAGATVEYALALPADSMLFVAFQARSGIVADTLVATVRTAGSGAPLASLRSAGSQDALYDRVASIPAAGVARDLVISVAGATPSVSSPFQLLARPLSSEPERSATALSSGAIVVEALDAPGDVDEFTLTGTAGYVTWLQLAADAPFPDGLRAELMDGGTPLATLSTTTAQASLGELESAPAGYPRSGSFTLRVRAGGGAPSANTGGYRLRVVTIPPANPPEPVVLFPRDRIVDTLAGTDSVHAWMLQWSTPEVTYGMTLEVLDAEPDDTLTATFRSITGDSLGAIRAVTGGGATSFAIPIGPAGAAPRSITATVRGRRHGIEAVYRVRLGSPLLDGPESVPAVIVPGDTIDGESIGDPFDMDRYAFDPAPADSEWVVMLVPTIAGEELGLRLEDRDAQLVTTWNVTGQWTDLERTATYIRLPQDRGPYTLTVGSEFPLPAFSGGYRLRVARVDRGTETAPARLAPDDTVQGVIEQPGDIDEFALDVTAGDVLYFHHRTLHPTAEQGFTLLDNGTPIAVQSLPDYALPLDQHTADYHRWVAPRTGEFRLRVQNGQLSGPRTNWPTAYSVEVMKVAPSPETLPATGWSYGDTIQGETLERRGDVDEFEVAIDSARMTRLTFIAHRADELDGAFLTVFAPNGDPMAWLDVGRRTGGTPNTTDTISVVPHLEFAAAGTYRFRVEGTGLSPIPFRFFLTSSYVGPEVVSDTIPLNTWVTGEAVDSIGDLDRFVVHVDSGVRYLGEIERLAGAAGGFALRSDVAFANTYGDLLINRATVTGWIRATVSEWPGLDGRALGPYRVRLTALDPLPETASPLLAIGDTVTSESLDMKGDEDTYTFTATAGTALRLTARPAGHATGARIAAQLQYDTGVIIENFDLGDNSAQFVVPATGSFRLVIRQAFLNSERDLGPYFLALVQP